MRTRSATMAAMMKAQAPQLKLQLTGCSCIRQVATVSSRRLQAPAIFKSQTVYELDSSMHAGAGGSTALAGPPPGRQQTATTWTVTRAGCPPASELQQQQQRSSKGVSPSKQHFHSVAATLVGEVNLTDDSGDCPSPSVGWLGTAVSGHVGTAGGAGFSKHLGLSSEHVRATTILHERSGGSGAADVLESALPTVEGTERWQEPSWVKLRSEMAYMW